MPTRTYKDASVPQGARFDTSKTNHRACVVALRGFHYAKTQEESDAMAAYFRQCFPFDKFPHMTVEQLFQDLPVKDGRVPKCTVVFPTEAAKLSSDAPLIGETNVWSKWSLFLFVLGAIIIGALCAILWRRMDELEPLYPISWFVLFGFCLALLWSVSRDRLWRILKTFDALYMMAYTGMYVSLMMYCSYSAVKDPVTKYVAMIGQGLAAIPFWLGIICIDAVCEHTHAKKVVITLIVSVFYWSVFLQFRFMPNSFPNTWQKVLKEIIEIGVFQAELGVLIGTAAMNVGMFILKYAFNLVRGKEFIIWKFDAQSHVLDIVVHDAVGAAVDAPAVQGEVDAENDDAENDDAERPCHVLNVPHDNAAGRDDHPAEQVGDREKSGQGDANDKGTQTDSLEELYGYRGKRMTL